MGRRVKVVVFNGEYRLETLRDTLDGGPQCPQCGSWRRSDEDNGDILDDGVWWEQTRYKRQGKDKVVCENCGQAYQVLWGHETQDDLFLDPGQRLWPVKEA